MGTTRLEPHRRAIFGMVIATWLAGGAWAFAKAPVSGSICVARRCFVDLGLFVQLTPYLGVMLFAAHALLRAVASRAVGETLDRRAVHLARASAACALFATIASHRDSVALVVVGVIAAGVVLGYALRDWRSLVGLLRSRELVEHPEVVAGVPALMEGISPLVTLYQPLLVGYRNDAKGAPVAVVPVDRVAARWFITRQVMVAVAMLAGIAMTNVGFYPRCHAAHSARGAQGARGASLEGSRWRGEIDFGARKDNFRIDIEAAANGELRGVMDWGDVAANVEGTYVGNQLVFFDRSIRRTNGAPFVLNDRKDVQIVGDEMIGTDKAGRVRLHAVRVR